MAMQIQTSGRIQVLRSAAHEDTLAYAVHSTWKCRREREINNL